MELYKFFETVIEPSVERLGLFGVAHDVHFDGRHRGDYGLRCVAVSNGVDGRLRLADGFDGSVSAEIQ